MKNKIFIMSLLLCFCNAIAQDYYLKTIDIDNTNSDNGLRILPDTDASSGKTATHPRYKDVPLLGKQVLNKLTIAPNPANSTVSVQLPPYFVEANATLLLYDLSGKQVKNWTIDNAANATELLVNDLPNGAYIMQYIVDGVALANAKIAIQH